MYMKKVLDKYYNLNINNMLKITDYLKYFVFLALLIIFIDKYFQNDTFYTIKIGELIKNNGIDFLDHFSFVKNLTYTYPHFLYDLTIYVIYNKFNYIGIYISTIIFSFIIVICLYKVNLNESNKYISFIITILELFLLLPFFTARAQIITFTLFILTYYFIENYLKKPKLIYSIFLIIIPILIVNTHVAVFPFYFVIYLPYLVEYFISLLFLKRNKKLNYYKLNITNNKNVKKLIIIFIICLFSGFVSPLKNVPYTYLFNTIKGDSLSMIMEHQPLVIINNVPYLLFLTFLISIMIFSKNKINLKDLFFFLGMTLLSFMSFRQISMAIIFNGFLLSKWINQVLLEKKLIHIKYIV